MKSPRTGLFLVVLPLLLSQSAIILLLVEGRSLPEQIHISRTQLTTQRLVTFVTFATTLSELNNPQDAVPQVRWGKVTNSGDNNIEYTNYYNGSSVGSYVTGWNGTIHTVLLSNLQDSSEYGYSVQVVSKSSGANTGWSSPFVFDTTADTTFPITVIAAADIGTSEQAQQVIASWADAADWPAVASELSQISAIIAAGDLTYSSQWQGDPPLQSINDAFFNLIQPIAGKIPFMTSPGNHEGYDLNFTSYWNRIGKSMPYNNSASTDKPMWYSFQIGPLFFISMMSEDGYYEKGSEQYAWLEQTLQQALQLKLNAMQYQEYQYTIIFSHHPMYSSSMVHGSDVNLRQELEPLLQAYYVDLAIWGHDHMYERSFPVYEEIVESYESSEYNRLGSTIHIIVGNSGANLYSDVQIPKPNWSCFRKAEFGQSHLSLHQNYSLHWSFVNLNGSMEDSFWIHKPFAPADDPTAAASGGDVTFGSTFWPLSGGGSSGFVSTDDVTLDTLASTATTTTSSTPTTTTTTTMMTSSSSTGSSSPSMPTLPTSLVTSHPATTRPSTSNQPPDHRPPRMGGATKVIVGIVLFLILVGGAASAYYFYKRRQFVAEVESGKYQSSEYESLPRTQQFVLDDEDLSDNS